MINKRMKKYKIVKNLSLAFLLVILFFLAAESQAADLLKPDAVAETREQGIEFAGTAGFALTTEVGDVVASVIKAFIALLGIIFVVLIVLAGNKWMNAGGDEEKVREAKDTIRHAIIGLIIIIAAYAITEFVFKNLPWGSGSNETPYTN